MCSPFLVSEDALQRLASTRQGRISIGGYNYQAAYAVARLAAMHVRSPLLGLSDWADRLRYDWREDLDEVCAGGVVRFTQCKRDASIGQPASLAKVLLGFAPKWLWSPNDQRERIRFRLICSDIRFAAGGTGPRELPKEERAAVQKHFVETFNQPAGAQSDRAEWDADAAAFGHAALFDAIWERTDALYLPPDVVDREPAGPRLFAEREALRALLERSVLGSLLQTESLGRLRRLVHDNLIEFDPASDREPALMQRTPRRLERADVVAALDVYRPSGGREPSFQVVDRTFLSEQRELPRELYVARAPEWSDLVHGQDPEIKFLEREQTADLQNAVLEHLVKPMQRRSGRLPALFVVGPPGSGKTTLVRRVAARLVDDGQILVADAGVGWREPAGDPEEYVEALTRLQAAGRPVVLLLDDPLYAESGWFDVFKRLNRPNLIAGILSATPQFLFDGHKHALRPLNHREYPIAPPSRAERTQLADLFRSKRQFDDRSDDDFLVLTIELAAGVSFDEIIDRLWTTLADGRDLGGFHTFESLPWQVRAFVFVCFFSRVYEQCPEPLLREALQLSGGVEGAGDVTTELARLRHQQGWRIFRIGRRARTAWDYQGVPISASHTQIARRAWQRRPLPWCDVEEVWLDDHADDTCVRTQCLTYLRKLPDDEFGRDRRQAAEETARWLEEHGGTSDIRMGFVAFAVQVATKGEPVFVAAEKQCQLLASELPNSVEVKHLCGKLLLKSERFSEAAHQFREALQIYPEHQAARWELGTALWKLNDFENAEREFRSAIHSAERKKNPRAPFYTSLGWLYVDWRRWRDAINAFQSARDECPDFFGNHWGIGRAEFELGDYDLAAESLRRALETPNLKPPASDEIPALLQECLKQAER